jgi:hypothetical protein
MPKPHIPQTFCFHRLHPLTHPIHGLTKHNILHFTHDMAHFVHLMVVVQDAIDYGFPWFPKIHQSHENVSNSQHDLLGLLSFNH